MIDSENNKPLPDYLILDLPDAPSFVSTPPKYTATEMIRICEAMLPYWNRIRFAESKSSNPTDIEPFSLV